MYNVFGDWDFSKMYTDADEWREVPINHRYIHGGFKDSGLKFSLYFPPVEKYQKRFFHFLSAAQGWENASQTIHGEDDKISFAISHGAYFIESNMGGASASGDALLKCNAAAAAGSRIIASKIYGEHQPYGYLYGGSGGSLKTCACFENTEGIWNGAVPFVIACPMAMPSTFTVRAHAMRILRSKLPQIIDSMEPGGNGNPYAGLSGEEADALEEVTKMGFPLKTWFSHYFIGSGALPLLAPAVMQADPTYFEDFWTQPGFLGYPAESSAKRDRIQFTTKISSVNIPSLVPDSEFTKTGVDDAWHIFDNLDHFVSPPTLELDAAPEGNLHLDGAKLIFLDGKAEGKELPLGNLAGCVATVGETFQPGLLSLLRELKPGDSIRIDNSNFIALQTYHRHQVPEEDYAGWRQFLDCSGNPVYPQRPLIGPSMAFHGSGGIQTGRFKGKMIVVASLMDEAAFPWIADWYRKKAIEHLGEKHNGSFRLWYIDNAMHAETVGIEAKLHVVGYLGALNQALLDLSNWVENGVAPPESTNYTEEDGQIRVSDDADSRSGIQPLVELKVNGNKSAKVAVGERFILNGSIGAPNGTGIVLKAEFDFDGQGEFDNSAQLEHKNENRSVAQVIATHSYDKPGVYFPVLRAESSRDEGDPFTRIRNLSRARVEVLTQETQRGL
jgi:hypothetical protein